MQNNNLDLIGSIYRSKNSNRTTRQADVERNQQLDKYYTKHEIAKICHDTLIKVINDTKTTKNRCLFIEPSAGAGAFLNLVSGRKIGFDIAPQEGTKIIKADFLKLSLSEILGNLTDTHKLIYIGNPPFGNRAKTAIEFLNKCLKTGYAVGFILPIQFRKWSAQSKITQDARLIYDMDLPHESFEFLGKDYSIRCCFQIWSCNPDFQNRPCLRISQKPKTSHQDFEIYQYNRTDGALKYFDMEWDFAVPRQGFVDFNIRAKNKGECNKKIQWAFFKAKNGRILENLLQIDFHKLSLLNTGTPGFGKADVIEEYRKVFGCEN